MNISSGFVAGMTVETKGLLSCLCFLLAACFTIPAWGGEPDMKVEEFAKKLEGAGGWPREKLEALLGVKFVDYDPGEAGVAGRLVYGKGLIVSQISHSRSTDTHETLSLMVLLSRESSCFTRDILKKLYPGTKEDDEKLDPAGWLLYVYRKPWGEIEFGFEPKYANKGDKYCLKSVETRTNKLLDLWKELYKKK